MATLPAEILYGTVTGKLLSGEIDSGDADELPEAVPISGVVTFKPSAQSLADAAGKAIVLPKPIRVSLDLNGNIVSPDGTLGVTLIASDSPSIQPFNFQWNVSFDLQGATLNGWNFYLPNGKNLDLAEMVQVQPTPGAFTVKGDPGTTSTGYFDTPRISGDSVILTPRSNWGIDSSGVPYYNAAGVPTADAAFLQVHSDGTPYLVKPNAVGSLANLPSDFSEALGITFAFGGM